MIITVTLTDAEVRILETGMVDISLWIHNALHEKCRRQTDKLVEQVTTSNPKKLSKVEKETMLEAFTLESAAERNAKFEALELAKLEAEK